ncbi:hypothetical protein O6H91_05G119000 [Diphasiastrum complanatum]|uniref:Uncharacterized protein n=1 Tax=Diphasiastrum complanatum TaxID=34168 RepID=A0ACC2DSL1_DIPCM|nr:hypothetical protein O6H91_05G119000 [Diphasiastrum complanatum]
MPSMASVPSISLGLTDDVDASFFDQLGDELDGPLCVEDQQEAENISILKGVEQKGLNASDYGNWAMELQPEKNQQLNIEQSSSGLNNAFSNLSVSENDPDLIVPSLSGVPAADMNEGALQSSLGQLESTNLANISVSHDRNTNALSEVQSPTPWASSVEEVPTANAVSESRASVSVNNLLETITDSRRTPFDRLSTDSGEGKDKLQTKVTEVEWSNFNRASDSCGQGGFGSYSDFFSQLNGIPIDQPWDLSAGYDKQQTSPLGSGSFQTNMDAKIKQQFADQPDSLQSQSLDANVLRDMTQYNMDNTQISPSQFSFNGHLSQAIQPVLPTNHTPSSQVTNIIQECTMALYQSSDVTGPCADSLTVPEGSVGLLQGHELNHSQPLEAFVQRDQAWGQYADSLTVPVASVGLLQGHELNHIQPGETFAQHNQAWGHYAVAESSNEHLYYDPQYPGWCYDYQTQEWREIPGYVQQGQIAGSIAISSQQNFAIEQDSSQEGTRQMPDLYAYGNVQSGSLYGAYNQKVESYGEDKPPNGSYLGMKQDVYDPIMEETSKSDYNQVRTEKFSYSASAQLSWAGTPSLDDHQTQDNVREINSLNPMFSNTFGPSQFSEPKQSAVAGHWNFGPISNDSTHFYRGGNADAYTSQFSGYSQHTLSQSIVQTPPRSTQEALRSSVGRPPYSNVTFGFGGKLVILKPKDPMKLETTVAKQSFFNGQPWIPGPVQVYQLSQIVTHDTGHGGEGVGNLSFATLGSEVFSGPLVGGNMSHKDILKWIDEKASICETEQAQSRNLESLRILWGSLKIACQNYGKLRSSPGTLGIALQSENGPEAALAKLLEPKKSESVWTDESLWTCASSADSLQSLPTEHQLQKEALHRAQEGQLWGPALVLARELGEKPYADTVADMARHQFRAGSPLQVLNFLFAGQPSEIFAGKVMSPISRSLTTTNAIGTPLRGLAQDGVDGLLTQWQENLAIMAANRTNGDEQVIMHLGDCLWERRGEVAAAHTCYLIADANFESFSNNSRLCLIGADHYKYPRTFASPEAVQRTELYEYSKVMGNPQFILIPFQPYKLVYASMLAEVGKVADASRYCQAVLKTLKTAGRSPEVEFCRQLAAALEERLRIHSQAGNFSNLAPGKLMGRLFNTLDKSIHRIMGAPPPPMNPEINPMTTLESSISPIVAVSQPANNTKTISPSLVPSASMEPIYDSMNIRGRSTAPARSVSEPDFSKGSKKEESQHGNPGLSSSYFGRFGSHLVKAVGLVVKLNSKEAKLGEKNKFYYDENLKRWVEEGVELPPEEPALPPPPTVSKQFLQTEFSTGVKANNSSVSEIPSPIGSGGQMSSLGTPPIPPSSNHFSARARHQGVRSRYVDTFNKTESAAPPRAVQSPLLPPLKSGGITPSKFFVPAQLPATQLDKSFSDQVANESSNGVAANLEKPIANTMTHSSQTESIAASANGDISQSENASMTSSAFNFMTPVAKPMKRVSSAGSTVAFGNLSMGTDISNTGDSDISKSRRFVPNGVHARAASWSDYPVSYGHAPENSTQMYPYQSSEIIESKHMMKRSLFSATEHNSSTVSYHYEVHPKPFSGVTPSTCLPPPPLLDVSSALLTNGGSTLDMGGELHMSSTPDKGTLDSTVPTDDLQEVEL